MKYPKTEEFLNNWVGKDPVNRCYNLRDNEIYIQEGAQGVGHLGVSSYSDESLLKLVEDSLKIMETLKNAPTNTNR